MSSKKISKAKVGVSRFRIIIKILVKKIIIKIAFILTIVVDTKVIKIRISFWLFRL